MNCSECKSLISDDNQYCGKCGAELGRTLGETVRKRGLRDRQAVELEITEAVTDRVIQWFKRIAWATGLPIALFTVLLGWTYHDIRSAVSASKSKVADIATAAETEIGKARSDAKGLDTEVLQLKSDVLRYQRIDTEIAHLQKQILDVRQEVDLGNKSLKANNLRLAGTLTLGEGSAGGGPLIINAAAVGCPQPGSVESKWKYSFCFDGDPPHLVIVTHSGAHKGARAVLP